MHYLDDLPVAILVNGTLSYLETDHLGTPRVAANPTTNAWQWQWSFFGGAFGDSAPTQAVSGGIDVNLRYPGQRFDSETGLNYNYFRDYEAGTGRYVESDLIGLQGGISTYAYVEGSPLFWIDPAGLAVDINTFKPNSDAYNAANNYPGLPTECTVAGHGTPNAVGGYSPRQMVKLIKKMYPQCLNKPVRLISCNTGIPGDHGAPPYGQRLARQLKVRVWAPNDWGWLHGNGDYQIGPAKPQVDWHVENAEEKALKNGLQCNCGQFVPFDP